MDLANRAILKRKILFLLHCFAKASAASISETHQPLAIFLGFSFKYGIKDAYYVICTTPDSLCLIASQIVKKQIEKQIITV